MRKIWERIAEDPWLFIDRCVDSLLWAVVVAVMLFLMVILA